MKRVIIAVAIAAACVAVPLYVHAQDQPALSCTTATPAGPGLQVVGQPRVTRGRLGVSVDGRVSNASDQQHSGIVTVTLFDDAANIVGVYRGAVNSVAANDEVTYTAIGFDMPDAWSAVEAKVSQL